MRYFGFVVISVVLVACSAADDEPPSSGAASATSGEAEQSSPGASSTPEEMPTPTGTLHEDVSLSEDRTFDMYEPASTDALRPAVIVFHGMPSNPTSVRNRSQLDVLADQEGFLVAYGRGVDERWQADVDSIDVEYVRNLVTMLVDDWSADPERIYVAGLSNGGDMAITAALSLPDMIAAAAPVVPSSTMNVEGVIAELAAPVDVMGFVGGRDSRYESGLDLLGAMRDGAGCGDEERTEAEDLVTTTWACPGDHTFVIHEVLEGGHAWFGFPINNHQPLWASEAMWEFFESVTP